MKQLLSPKDLGRATGVSESSLSCWADSGRLEWTCTAGGQRRIRPRPSGYLRIQHLCGGSVHAGITTQSRPAKSIEESNEYFSEMVLSGREEEAIGYLSHEYLSGNSFASLCDGPVRHCLSRSATPGPKPLTAKRRIFALLKSTVPSTSFCAAATTSPHGVVSGDRRSRLRSLRATPLGASVPHSLPGDTENSELSQAPFEVLRTAAVRAKAKLVLVRFRRISRGEYSSGLGDALRDDVGNERFCGGGRTKAAR